MKIEIFSLALPVSDFGRLSLELLRPARLVVDTGMRAKKWTRDQAIDYLKQNTPNSEGECVDAINRYIVMPYHKCLVRFPVCRRAFVLRKSSRGPALSEVTRSRMGEWPASCRAEVASRSAVPSVRPDF